MCAEGQIKIRYNNLCRQFESNTKYIALETTQELSDDEDISYKMTVNHKQYEAIYFQLPREGIQNRIVWFTIKELFGEYHIVIYYENENNNSHGEDL